MNKVFTPPTPSDLQASISDAMPNIIDKLYLATTKPTPAQLHELSRSLVGLTILIDHLARELSKDPHE